MEHKELMEADGFIAPYRRRNTRAIEEGKLTEQKRNCQSSCFCLTVLIIICLSLLVSIAFLLIVISNRVRQLGSYHASDSLLFDMFRSERIECFYIEPRERMFINADATNATLNAVKSTGVSYIDSVISPQFHLSGYGGQILMSIQLHKSTGKKYLYIKYRPNSGDNFPMYKKIFLKLLHPNNPELGVQKQFNTREEITKGAAMFVQPNGEFWGANFCDMDIIEPYVNNKLVCISISICALVSQN